MILRTIYCDRQGCEAHETEAAPNRGWPGWGSLEGVQLKDDDGRTVSTNASVCPGCLQAIMETVLNASKPNDLEEE